jgi:hypothetical protein
MNEANARAIRELAGLIGDELKGKLPPLPDHPERNSYAHVWRSIKEKFGASYKELSDEQVPEIVEFLEYVRNNPA